MTRRAPSLITRLVLVASIGMVGAVVLPLGTLVYLVWVQTGEAAVQADLQARLDAIEQGLVLTPGSAVSLEQPAPLAMSYDALPKDAAFRIVDGNGGVLAHSPPGPALQALSTHPGSTAQLQPTAQGAAVSLHVARRTLHREGRALSLEVAVSDRLIMGLRARAGELYLQAAIATTALSVLVFTALVYVTVRRMVRPITQASSEVARIGPRNLSGRVTLGAIPREVVPLAGALNAALDRLEHGYQVQREFLGSVAHELKTPLSLLQAELQLSPIANKAVLLQDVQLMARQVNQLLHLAEVSELHNYTLAPVSVAEVAREVMDALRRLAEANAVHLRCAELAAADVIVAADRGALYVLIRNLLENAVRYSPSGGTVLLEIDEYRLSVQDEGPGIPDAQRENVFERFWRADRQGATGSGLGLAICREICTAHGWSIHLRSMRAGRGCRFVVVLSAS